MVVGHCRACLPTLHAGQHAAAEGFTSRHCRHPTEQCSILRAHSTGSQHTLGYARKCLSGSMFCILELRLEADPVVAGVVQAVSRVLGQRDESESGVQW